eukprot:7340342-Heterocapsa_arctica.AAC.1
MLREAPHVKQGPPRHPSGAQAGRASGRRDGCGRGHVGRMPRHSATGRRTRAPCRRGSGPACIRGGR